MSDYGPVVTHSFATKKYSNFDRKPLHLSLKYLSTRVLFVKLIAFLVISVTKLSLRDEQECRICNCACWLYQNSKFNVFLLHFEEKKLVSRSVYRRVPRDPAESGVMTVRPACRDGGGILAQV